MNDMKIETKYNVGDKLYFLKNNEVIIRQIEEISLVVNKNKTTKITCGYRQYPNDIMGSNPIKYVNEIDAFFTKDELLKSL